MNISDDGQRSRQKVFVLDTSVLIHDPSCLGKFDNNIVVLPFCVIEELDKLKNAPNSVGENARRTSQLIDRYKKQGSLKTGVPIGEGGLLFGDYTPKFKQLFPQGAEKSNDNIIIATAKKWQEAKDKKDVFVVSKDINLRLKASIVGIKEQDYLNDKVADHADKIYSGFAQLSLPSDLARQFLGDLAQDKKVEAELIADKVDLASLFPNQGCKIQDEESGKYVLAIYKKPNGSSGYFNFVEKPKPVTPESHDKKGLVVRPINDEQALAYALLSDPEILLVTLIGKAGSGKTLISLLAGCDMLNSGQRERLKVYRPNIVMGKGLGFLPGDLAEKFDPWTLPITDNLSLIVNGTYSERAQSGNNDMVDKKNGNHDKMEELLRAKIIEIIPTIYSRGRSLHRQFVILDESQNLTPHEAKTMITRIGLNSKIVLTGDLAQIDSPYLDSTSNGLAHVVQRMKGQHVFGHITLIKSERSYLAELAADLL